jgi:dihydroxyacetone kinase-like protein
MLVLNKQFFVDSLLSMAELAEEQRDHWTKLDSDIGDGDHGINLSIGFRAVAKQLETLDFESTDIASRYKKVGMTLLSKVGGASGPLYGSFFMKAGTHLDGEHEVDFKQFTQMIQDGVDAIAFRGKASLGDKTMLDAFLPGLEVLSHSDLENEPLASFEAFVARMKLGSDETIPLICKKGRAVRLGERAIGHRDPGSESAWMLMNVYLEQLRKIV